jgi:hypothetical protein
MGVTMMVVMMMGATMMVVMMKVAKTMGATMKVVTMMAAPTKVAKTMGVTMMAVMMMAVMMIAAPTKVVTMMVATTMGGRSLAPMIFGRNQSSCPKWGHMLASMIPGLTLFDLKRKAATLAFAPIRGTAPNLPLSFPANQM